MTCSKVARRLGISLPAAEEQERPSSDILLSDLYRWQKVLGVPAAELLKEPNGQLSKPVALRAKLVRVMKTAKSIQERADRIPVRRLAQSLARQLVRIMPELQDTTAWPVIGPHRGENELGQAFFRRLPSGPWDVLDRTEE
jgi:transcriptional regulator with XRE-family HTH domain